jgi:hypothetical protein
MAEREAELLPVPYFHVVYTLPAPISDIAHTNKAVIYDLLFRASVETALKIAAKRAGAAVTSVKCCGSDACYWAPSGKQLFVCFREVRRR